MFVRSVAWCLGMDLDWTDGNVKLCRVTLRVKLRERRPLHNCRTTPWLSLTVSTTTAAGRGVCKCICRRQKTLTEVQLRRAYGTCDHNRRSGNKTKHTYRYLTYWSIEAIRVCWQQQCYLFRNLERYEERYGRLLV